MNIGILQIARIFLALLTGLIWPGPGQAQHQLSFEASKLNLSWKVLQRSYQGKSQVLTALTLSNTGDKPLPASGWKLYFNHNRKTTAVLKGNVRFEFINGDLHRLVPTAGFKAIAPGSSLRLEYVVPGRIVNKAEAPAGFYLVWDDNPQQGWPTGALRVLEPAAAGAVSGPSMTPAMIYEKNKASGNVAGQKLVKIFPRPAAYRETSGDFSITAAVPIQADAAFMAEASLFAAELGEIFGLKPAILPGAGSPAITQPAIILKKIQDLAPEAYQLSVSPREIVIRASTGAGIFYGLQSLKTMFPPEAWAWKQTAIPVAGVEVSDAPRFGYRAFMMDVARNFQTKQQVFRILDLMALYKLNVLHFHLNDDEGWRLEIPALPELTQVGGRRGHTLDGKTHLPPSHGSGPEPGLLPGSGFYSKDDFVEILRYARQRHIRIIPEVETPGHARAAIKAMDARYERLQQAGRQQEAEQYLLRDLQDKSVYRSVQDWNDNVINVALPSTYTFIETVVDEIRGMYREAGASLSTIHLGGDEVPAGVWTRSPAVQALLQSRPELKSPDDLWYYYFGKVNEILKARNLYLSGWEEVAMRKVYQKGKTRYVPNPDFAGKQFHAYVWNNVWGWGQEDLAYRLANAGYKVVLAPVTNMYLDMAYYPDFEEPGLYWGSFIDVDKPFYFVPLDYYKSARENLEGKPLNKALLAGKERLTTAGRANIVGLQCLLWSETIKSPERQEYMLLPKMLGFAERAWAPDPVWAREKDPVKSAAAYNQDWQQFVATLGKRELPRLDHYQGGYAYRIPTAGAIVDKGQVKANVQFPGLLLRYTTDGSEPDLDSELYTGPITEKGQIRLRVFTPSGRAGRTIVIHNR